MTTDDNNAKIDYNNDKEERKPFLITKHNTSIYFNENWDVGIGGGLWSTGLCLSKYFLEHSEIIKNNLKQLLSIKSRKSTKTSGIRAIELGSGNGLLSCCLAAVVGDLLETLIVTDLSDHIELMKQTVLANSHLITLQMDNVENLQNNQVVTQSSSYVECHVLEHSWGEFESSGPLSEKFDFIFGSDVAYRDYLHKPLISSLLHFSDKHTISIIGVTMSDTKPIFFKLLREAGFQYERIPDHLMSQEFRGTTFGLFVIKMKPTSKHSKSNRLK